VASAHASLSGKAGSEQNGMHIDTLPNSTLYILPDTKQQKRSRMTQHPLKNKYFYSKN
jgi:hypothetical protein